MKYLLDTDHISFLQRRSGREYSALAARIRLHSPTDFAFPIVSFHEQILGAHTFIARAVTSADVLRGYSMLLEILTAFQAAPVLPYEASALAIFDGLQAQRIRIPTMDMRIAAIALSHGLVLLTRNIRDFGKVPGLATQDWAN